MLSAGGVLAGLGFVGASTVKLGSDDDQSLGADGFTAKTVPAGSDPLVLIEANELAQNDAAKAATRTLLGAGQFGDLPDALVEAFADESGSAEESESLFDVGRVGKLVLVGSDANANAGGAVVWADLTDDELVTVLESGNETDARTESYGSQTLYTTGETSAATLGDTEFALGTPEVVRDIVDVWYGDAEPVGGETLDSFERTPLGAHVRFSFDELQLACDDVSASQSDVYDAVTQIYGSVSGSGDAVRLQLRVESNAAASETATAVSDDLGLEGGDDPEGEDAGLPHKVRNDVTVEHEHDFVVVEYDPRADGNAEVAGVVVETITCLTGRSE